MNIRGNDFAELRREMVTGQLLGRDIKDKNILDVFERVPRHRFIDHKFYKDAYGDFPLSIGNGQTISQPYMVALMAQLLDIKKSDRILEIGTGSGYQTAILAELANQVFSVERLKNLTENSSAILEEMGYKNITLKTDDGTMGWKDFAPFDKIVVTAGGENVPEPLLEQLKSPGRLVMPVGPRTSQKLLLVEKTDKGDILEKEICACVFVPLIGKYGWKQ
ncbi:MAG: protein-L-isoaspartate(D-aspartate) O-methyltransferase [Candidatus Omnitrophota bacterium]|nr:protein-L-isoaspartate(D-aspartate) O-methyltransferase [Candidatus Omnitrophota bacterium]